MKPMDWICIILISILATGIFCFYLFESPLVIIPTPNARSIGGRYNVVVLDGCEYVQFADRSPTHKGNCTNTIHRSQHESPN